MMENWHSHFVPECYFDTVLFKKILETNKRLKHTKGCNNVVNRFRIINGKKGDLYDSFGVGMVDKDKKDLDFLYECEELINEQNFILWKHKERSHFIIQLNPPLEKWVIEILRSDKKSVGDFGYPANLKKLKAALKDDIDNENNERLNLFVDAILSSSNPAIEKLKKILLHLKDKNYQIDINELKNV
jgi:hypothetical protein